MTKKKAIAFISIGVSIVLIVSAIVIWFVVRNGNQNAVETPDNTIHYVEGTLHKVNVTESNVKFVENKQSNYKIYVDLTNESLKSAINKSADFVKEHVLKATGANLEIETEKPMGITENDYAIIYGNKEVFEGQGLKMPTDDIGTSGYYIKTKGNLVFIEANGSDGYRLGGLAFLREVLGYDMIAEDCVVYSRNWATMPKMEVIEKPDFDYRQISNYYTSIEVYGMGMHTNRDIWMEVNGWDMHNSLYFIPVEKYAKDHPDWYRADRLQPCYTAHGNKVEYELMLETVFEVVKKKMDEYPTLENISFTAMDGTGQDSCTCETCLEYRSLYGTPAATCIYFMNDLNKIVQKYISDNNLNRQMNLVFFAYHDSEPAPVERKQITSVDGNITWGDPIADENGNYKPLKRYARDGNNKFIKDGSGNYVYEKDENGNYVYLRCDDNVFPWLAPIYSKYTSSFYDERNATYAKNVTAWNVVSKNVYVWIYGTNFTHYLIPYNTWSPVTETYKFLKENGVKYAWNQAQERNQSTAFTDLKDYIDSKFMFDVNADYAKVIDDYFDNYFLEASDDMRSLFNLIQAQSTHIEKTIEDVSGGIYDDIGAKNCWPRLLMEQMLDFIDNAYKAVEKYKYTNPELYQNLVKRINKESIFPRYVICSHYAEYYANIQEMRASFRDDWNKLGFSVYKEHDGDMQSIFTNDWGL